MRILLKEVLAISNQKDYKVHFAKWNGKNQPLDVFTKDRQEWQGWQEYRPSRDDFNRPYIFSLAHIYHEPDTWLFGGIFSVIARHPDHYEVALSDVGSGFIGRLKLRSSYDSRLVRVMMENVYDDFEVVEILRESYTGRPFPGFEDIDLSFEEMETLVRNDRPDWKSALESVKGIYLITDTSSGKRYVGSACGAGGVWARWCTYIQTGHGGNVELRSLLGDPGLDYCRSNFRFALLEHRPFRMADQLILGREGFWKRLLLTRTEYGLNRN